MPEWSSLPIEKINAGRYRVVMRYEDGKTEEKMVVIQGSQDAKLKFNHRPDARLNTFGFSIGSGLPAFTATVHGTIATGDYQFLALGMDFGLLNYTYEYEYVKYSSFRLFARYNFFQPFANGGGWHIGLGGGFMTQTLESIYDSDWIKTLNGIVVDFSTGFIFRNGMTLSLSGFIGESSSGNYKYGSFFIGGTLALGWSYRFKAREKREINNEQLSVSSEEVSSEE